MRVSPAFENFVFDWDYETYLLIGSYGSGKSHAIVQKLVLLCLQEMRKVCVFRAVYETHKESTFDLIKQVLDDLGLLAPPGSKDSRSMVTMRQSPFEFRFPNGSRIIFKGMDDTQKLKSLNGVSVVWIEECTEVTLEQYLELLGRIRTRTASMHFILSCNPVSRSSWVYRQFFATLNDDGTESVILDEETFYARKALVKGRVYYHHSTCDDNPFLPEGYIARLDDIKAYDPSLWVVARLGRFGATGLRVLPQFEVMDARLVEKAVTCIPARFHRCGMDFGFETSFNAVVKVAIDDRNKWLYIYDELYRNHITDDRMKVEMEKWDRGIKQVLIKADCASPKDIRYYRQEGFRMVPCKKLADSKSEGSRIANTRKVKRFKRVICSTMCPNAVRELQDLTYTKKRDGTMDYSKFNIDSHVFSSIWYCLDDYTVADLKERIPHTRKGK